MKKALSAVLVIVIVVAAVLMLIWYRNPRIAHVKDEALRAGRGAETFQASADPYLHDMDGGIALNADEIKGRNTWVIWTGGNDRLWDQLTKNSFGALDLLKTISSHPKLKATRDNRWHYYGMVNEPGFETPKGPDPQRFGLWLDQRGANCPPDPFEDEQKYPGVKIGARGKNLPVGSYYGYATGIVGLRMFPNPDFDEAAQKKWDAERYYTDPSYYNSKDVVRPYRVGMSCGFCHVGPNPVKPPADAEHPQWANLSSNVGAQYMWADRVLIWDSDQSNFVTQLFQTWRPGTLDTSFVSTDNINNPRTMNALYHVLPRVLEAKRWGLEKLQGGDKDNKQLNDYVSTGPLADLYKAPDTVWTPRILKDGADSVGVMGALNRVYLNIGTFSEEWLLHFNALVGGKPISPITIAVSRKNSGYFAATENQTFATAEFFLKSTNPHKLADAPGGDKYLTKDAAVLNRGKIVFAETCARCHSSKLPENAPGFDANAGCAGRDYLTCFKQYWAWTQTEDFKTKMRAIVLDDNFLKDNYLSAEIRVPVTLLHTNACSPLATNGLANNIWDNFTSQSYKELPSVGQITWYHPVTGEQRTYTMPAGGRGYTRPPSLVSLWSTAPFLLNNSVGRFDENPSIDARVGSFQDSIEQMLWPERRKQDSRLAGKIPGIIDRTSERCYIKIAGGYLPDALQSLKGVGQTIAPQFVKEGGIVLGPIPKGTPISLLANINPFSEDPSPTAKAEHAAKLLKLVKTLNSDLHKLGDNATDEQVDQVFRNSVDQLLELSKCPDLVVNRGHYFGTDFREPGEAADARPPGLSDSDKQALIEFLKTF